MRQDVDHEYFPPIYESKLGRIKEENHMNKFASTLIYILKGNNF